MDIHRPSAKGLAEEIKRLVPDISIKDADNTVKLGISRVQKLLSFGCLKLSRKQPWLIRRWVCTSTMKKA